MDLKLEVVNARVSDVDRARRFYEQLGWRLDADFVTGPDFRVVQFTPPGIGRAVFLSRHRTKNATVALHPEAGISVSDGHRIRPTIGWMTCNERNDV